MATFVGAWRAGPPSSSLSTAVPGASTGDESLVPALFYGGQLKAAGVESWPGRGWPCHRSVTPSWLRPMARRYGLGMVACLRPDARVVDVAGDNLAVVRFCAGVSRLRRPAMQAILTARLGALEEAGWVLQWRAVRRRLNGEADQVATQALFWAASMCDRATWRHHTLWAGSPSAWAS